MPEYDSTNFHPPAPVAKVTLRNLGDRSLTVEASLLIDTGADITLIPAHLVGTIGAMPLANKHYELLGFNGSASTAQAVVLDLMFLGRRFHGQYLLCDQNWGILGRGVLNHLSLVLDSPDGSWREGIT